MDLALIEYFARFAHIVFGIAWIGLLYYFNFVQGGYLAKASDEAKISAFTSLVPSALWWFRWAALLTFLTGAYLLHAVYPDRISEDTVIAALLATFMAANVWFIIWPNQKVVIKSNESLRDGGPADPNQGSAAAAALLASRTNTLFSIPMVATMVSSTHAQFGGLIEGTSYGMFILLALIFILELNAIFGKMNPLIKSVQGVIVSGVVLTAVTLLLLNYL